MEWNREQQAAIQTRGANILVSAGAGSGKTAVLTQRIIRLIQEGASLTDFLIITFTKAAAAEMRERISRELEKQNLSKEKELLPIAHISTIHSFCHQVIAEHFELVGLSAKTHLITDMLEVTMKAAAMEQTLNELYEDLAFRELAQRLSPNHDQELSRMLMTIHSFARCKPGGLAFFEQKNQAYRAGEKKEITDCLLAHGRDLMDEVIQKYDRAVFSFPEGDPLGEVLSGDQQSLLQAYADLREETLSAVSFARRPKIADPDLAAHIDALRKQAKDAVKQVKTLFQSLSWDNPQIYLDLSLLFQGVRRFDEIYTQGKAKRGALDFHDLESYALDILQDESVSKSYREQFAYVMVDEYQDTNEMQEAIIQRIKRPDNLFMVGDMKQSIYRFRMADPSIFYDKYQAYKDGGVNRKIQLNRNYRSSETILNCINDVFSILLNTGKPLYDEGAYLKTDVFPGGDPVEIHVLEKPAYRPDEIETEARFVAEQMLGLHKEGYGYHDMAVLLRNVAGGPGHIFSQVFTQYGIPSALSLSGTGHNFVETTVFLNYLHLIDNKQNDLALLSVLHSPAFGFTLDDRMAIRLAGGDTYCQSMKAYGATHEDGLSAKIQAFWERLSAFKRLSRQVPVEQFLSVVLEETGYLSYLATQKQGEDKVNAVYQLLRFAQAFEEQGYHGLYEFLSFEERLKSTGHIMEALPIASDQDAVTILSIHKSKGLEYPVVFVPRLHTRPVRTQRSDLFYHKDLGFGLRYFNRQVMGKADVALTQAIAIQNQYDSLEEELRVFYVAMTRAQKRLILTGMSDENWIDQDFDAPINRFTLLTHNNMLKILLHAQENSFGRGAWEIQWHPAKPEEEENAPALQAPRQLKPQASPEIDALLSAPKEKSAYPIPTKISVSQLSKSDYTGQNLTQVSHAAQAGTMVHSALSHLQKGDTLDTLIERLKVGNYYTDEEWALMDQKLLANFFASALFARVQKASTVFTEKPFVLLLHPPEENVREDTLVQGVMDCVFWENGGWVLVDYKTDRIQSDIEGEIRRRYQGQLNLYAKALTKLTGKPVLEKTIYLLSRNVEIHLE